MQAVAPQQSSDLFRRAVIELAELHDADLASVVEFVAELKRHKHPRQASPETRELLALARVRAEELRRLPPEDVMQRFNEAVERIRAQAIENDTAINGDYHGD